MSSCCCCCLRRKKSPAQSRSDSRTAVNEQYMEWRASNGAMQQQQQQPLTAAPGQMQSTASDDHLYIDPDEVPEHIRLHQQPHPPRLMPPPPPPPSSAQATASLPHQQVPRPITIAVNSEDLVYAELETNALSVPKPKPKQRQVGLQQVAATLPAAAPATSPHLPPALPPLPPALSAVGPPSGEGDFSTPVTASLGKRDSDGEKDDGGNLIYSDIVGVLRIEETQD